MTGNFASDWPVYFLSVGVLIFFAYVIIKGNITPKDKK